MEAWKLLIGSDIGLMSLFTIGFVIAMGVYLAVYAKRKAVEDARNAK
jgi:ABC-type phosphate transport system permease subunit